MLCVYLWAIGVIFRGIPKQLGKNIFFASLCDQNPISCDRNNRLSKTVWQTIFDIFVQIFRITLHSVLSCISSLATDIFLFHPLAFYRSDCDPDLQNIKGFIVVGKN